MADDKVSERWKIVEVSILKSFYFVIFICPDISAVINNTGHESIDIKEIFQVVFIGISGFVVAWSPREVVGSWPNQKKIGDFRAFLPSVLYLQD